MDRDLLIQSNCLQLTLITYQANSLIIYAVLNKKKLILFAGSRVLSLKAEATMILCERERDEKSGEHTCLWYYLVGMSHVAFQ